MSNEDKSPQDIYDALTARWRQLADRLSFDDEDRRIDSLGDTVASLSDRVEKLRKRGYVFGNALEADAVAVGKVWAPTKRKTLRLKRMQSNALKKEADEVEKLVSRADKRPNLFDDLERQLDAFERDLKSAEAKISDPLDELKRQIDPIDDTIYEAEQLFELLEAKSFDFLPDENPVAARQVATLGRNEVAGVLFLTDKRLLFESREKRATKKRLFVTVESEIVSQVEWEAPIGAVKEISAEDKGGFLGFGVKEMLLIEFADGYDGAPNPATLKFTENGDNEAWADFVIPEVVSGAISQQMVASAADEDDWDPSTLPTTCPNCMATLPQIFKGMDQVTCEYCGTVVNVHPEA